jgi:hypothetical protein
MCGFESELINLRDGTQVYQLFMQHDDECTGCLLDGCASAEPDSD